MTSFPIQSGFAWNLGALEADRRHLVVIHYRHRYPALDWSWLLETLAELRLLGEPRSAVGRFVDQHQLGSAQTRIERIVEGVGLWVVEEVLTKV